MGGGLILRPFLYRVLYGFYMYVYLYPHTEKSLIFAYLLLTFCSYTGSP